MQVFDLKVLQEKYADTRIKVDPYYIKRTGFLAPLTILKLGEYNLSTVPAFINFKELQTLAVLTPQEVSLFSRYSAVMNSLTLNYEQPEKSEPMRLHLKVNLLSIDPIPGRPNVCFINLKTKTTPAELIHINGAYLEELDHRRTAYEKLSTAIIAMTPESSALLGYKGYCELISEGERSKVELKSFTSKSVEITGIKDRSHWMEKGPVFLKMPFGIAQPSLEVTLKGEDAQEMDLHAELPFNHELLEVIEDYQFKLAMAGRKKSPPRSTD